MADVPTADSGKNKLPAKGVLGKSTKKRLGVRVDMTPMVDVAFLLLIFFMVTTVFRRPLAMEVNLPEPDAKVEVPESNVVSIYVDKDESMFVKAGKAGIEPITWQDLRPNLEAAEAENPDTIFLVKIHRQARYEPMVDMMDMLEDAGLDRFSMVPMKDRDIQALESAR